MLGLLRRDPDHDVLEELASLLNSDRKALLNRNCVAGAMLAKQMLPSLLEKRAYNDAIRWIEAHGANCATSIATIVLGWTAHALQQVQDPSSLRRVLRSTIDHAAPNLSEQEGSLARLLERRLAIALRLEGRLDHAEKVIEQLLESCGDDDERAHLLDQRILIHLGVRSLETLELPEDDAPRKQLLDSITRRRLEIVEAISGGSPSPIALVALALPAVADRSPQEEARAEAVGWLRRALDPMRGGGEVWERSGLLARVRFYLSVLELRSGKADDAASAAGRLVALLEEEARLPGEFFLDQVEDIAIHDVRQVNELARLALVRYGHRALKKLDLETLSRRSVEFRRALSETLDGPGREFKNAERWPAWEQLLRGALEATPRDLESAEQALGALEALSTGPDLSERFVELLEVTPPLWDPVWESTERDEARFRIYRDLGRLEQARAVLVPLAHAAITEGRLGYASELLEMLGDLPVDQAAREGLSVRLAAAQTLTPPPLSRAATPPVSVFFIGGNETQAAYERQLRQAIHEKHPSTSLEFKFPGWGANWGRVLQHTETQIARSDVVVVMRFMRTHLGRAVRRLASKHEKPWVPCTGHGYASLERAIIEAVHLAAR
jgi:tetratricopeptide (TPR) repeat protein